MVNLPLPPYERWSARGVLGCVSVIACRVRRAPPVSCFGKLFCFKASLHAGAHRFLDARREGGTLEVRAAVLTVAQHLVAVRVPMYGTSIYDCAFLITGECGGMTDTSSGFRCEWQVP